MNGIETSEQGMNDIVMSNKGVGGALPGRQGGVAILAVTMILLLVTTIAAMTIGRVGLFEQTLSGTDTRSKEVYSAAVGGLEFGVDWIRANYQSADWAKADAATDPDDCGLGATTTPDAAMDATALQTNTYNHTIEYTAITCLNPDDDGMPVVIQVSSLAAASAAGDSHVTKTVRVDVMIGKTPAFSKKVFDPVTGEFEAPPIVIEECSTGNLGNPDVFTPGIGLATTNGDVGCIDPGHIDQYECDGCPAMEFPIAGSLPEPASLWNTVFGPSFTKGDLLAMETRLPESVFVVNSSYPHHAGQPPFQQASSTWGTSVGSADSPVLLFFDASVGCPNFQGNTVIYGIVYVETEDCDNQGFGSVDIHGTLAQSGNMQALNANTDIYGTSLDFGSVGDGEGDGDDETTTIRVGFHKAYFAEIPGTWRDF